FRRLGGIVAQAPPPASTIAIAPPARAAMSSGRFMTPPQGSMTKGSAIADQVVRHPARLARRSDRAPGVRPGSPDWNRVQVDDLGRRLADPGTQWLAILPPLGQECLVGGVGTRRGVGQIGRRIDPEDCREEPDPLVLRPESGRA